MRKPTVLKFEDTLASSTVAAVIAIVTRTDLSGRALLARNSSLLAMALFQAASWFFVGSPRVSLVLLGISLAFMGIAIETDKGGSRS